MGSCCVAAEDKGLDIDFLNGTMSFTNNDENEVTLVIKANEGYTTWYDFTSNNTTRHGKVTIGKKITSPNKVKCVLKGGATKTWGKGEIEYPPKQVEFSYECEITRQDGFKDSFFSALYEIAVFDKPYRHEE